MITFSQLGKYGRLGNQLFQYAALRSLSLKRGYECKIPDPKTMEWHGQKCLLGNLNIEAGFLTPEDYKKINYRYTEGNINKFDNNFFYLGDGADIIGFFQSVKYFNEFEKQIRKELMPKKEILEEAKDFVENERKKNTITVSVHLRMGDLIDGANPVYNNFYGPNITDSDYTYGNFFHKAMKQFKHKQVTFLVFAGGSRENKKEGPSFMKDLDERFVFCSSDDTMKDFSRIICCDHNVCCHLTTFGWWGAYLNQNQNKKVLMPKNYFLEDINREGFFPSNWELI